ncbi:MAG: hypothetical protein C0391_02910 [Anaerolinea sp.]|nr:hypothetical protein [Anaerolinea sp.]
MRKFLLAIALLLGIFFLYYRFSEVEKVADTLQKGVLWFILAGILLEILWYINIGASYQAIYKILGMDEKLSRLTLLSMAAFFVNIIAPSAGVGGVAVFVGNGNSNNHSPAKITIAGALFVVFDYAGFLVVLLLGLAVLARRNKLDWPEISASVILVLIALFLTSLLYLGAKSAAHLGKALGWLARLVNNILFPFIKKDYLSIERAYSFAREAAEGIQALRMNPRNWIKPFLLAFSSKALLITILMMVFLAFKVPFSAGTIIAGFSIGYLFLIVSPTPNGIGIVEGMLTLSLKSLYVPLEAAGIIVLAYRGITFWLPLLFGFIAFRITSHAKQTEIPRTNAN